MTPLAVIAVGAPGATPAFSPHSAIGIVENVDGKSLASIGNEWLDRLDCEVFGICHFDVEFGPGALDIFYHCASAGFVCGIVGIDNSRNYRWSRNGAAVVSTLDSCSVFFRKDLGLRFDAEMFDGFYCHVEDVCLAAKARDIPVVVPAASANHLGAPHSDKWLADFWHDRELLRAKWGHLGHFEMT